jgi:hypothetical protein
MKTRLTATLGTLVVLLLVVAAIFAPAAAQQTRTDLSARRALYFSGKDGAWIIDLKNDRYAADNHPMTLRTSEATKCEDGGCYFALKFIAFRTPEAGVLKTFAMISVPGYSVGNVFTFADKEGTKQGGYMVRLVTGTNRVTFDIDKKNLMPETDENNNSFTVTIIVEGKP